MKLVQRGSQAALAATQPVFVPSGILNDEYIPEFTEPDWEAHVSAWIQITDVENGLQWRKGAIAASVEVKFGESSLEKFAAEVGEPYSNLRIYRQVYNFYKDSARIEGLSWQHHREAMDAADAQDALRNAADKGLSSRQLRKRVKGAAVTKQNPEMGRDTQFADAAVEWAELRAHIGRFIEHFPQYKQSADDFISDIDDGINNPWESARDHIERLIERGTQDIEGLAGATHCDRETVQQMCDELVKTGDYKWVTQGGKTEGARGARKQLIVYADSATGDEL